MDSIEKEWRDLREKLFLLKMQDHWDSEDYKYADELRDKIQELEGKIDKNE